jgi:hypothetical protein
MDEPPPFDADPEAGADQQPPGSCQADPSALADGAANGDAGSGAAEKAHVVAGSRKRGVKRRVNAPVVDPPTDLQIRWGGGGRGSEGVGRGSCIAASNVRLRITSRARKWLAMRACCLVASSDLLALC